MTNIVRTRYHFVARVGGSYIWAKSYDFQEGAELITIPVDDFWSN